MTTKILSPDAAAEMNASHEKAVNKIAKAINQAIKSTQIDDRESISIPLDMYPEKPVRNRLIQIIKDAGWTKVKFGCEDRPRGSAWIEIKR